MRHALSVVTFVALAGACSHESTAPPVPTTIASGATVALIGTVSVPLTPAPTFTVRDASGRAIANVPVTIAVTAGGGTLTGAPTKSGSGETPVGTWVLGSTPGTNSLTVTSSGLPPLVITATARPTYYIDMRFFGPNLDPAVQAAFTAATARVQTIIVGEQSDVVLTSPLAITPCFPTGVATSVPPAQNETIDDLVIYATVQAIDGPGGILGSSGPCYVRTGVGSTELPVISTMRLDASDLQNLANDGRITDVITHEMLHTLGFGVLWNQKGFSVNSGLATSGYTGAGGLAGCRFHGGSPVCVSNVPLENTGTIGGGTRDVHWRETTFLTELMTGFVSGVGRANPLSQMTIGSMADLGYAVNLNAADSYTVPSPAAVALAQVLAAEAPREPLREEVTGPRFSVTRDGRVTPFTPRR